MNQQDVETWNLMLTVARNAIDSRAQLDEYEPGEYDAEHDPEGYVTSLINALHQWCQAHEISWETELVRAQGFFEQDVEGLEQGFVENASRPPIAELCCPKCGSREAFVIEVSSNLLMFPDDVTLQDDAGEEWGDWSLCRCYSCDHRGTVYQFRTGMHNEEDEGDG